MSGTEKHWTTRDLELYHDGELDTARRAQLSDALRSDHDLCERLAVVRRVDEQLRTAFVHPEADQPRRPLMFIPFGYPALAAACLLIAVSAAGWFSVSRHPAESKVLAIRHDGANVTSKPEYQAIRVVFSLPVETRSDDVPTKRSVKVTKAKPYAGTLEGFLTRLDKEMAAGRIKQSLALLRGASDEQRTVAYLHVGARLRSATVAKQILDRLSPREQLFVCRLWVRMPVVQPTVFERLQRFSSQPELYKEVRQIVVQLVRDPRLRPWLHGYQLVALRNTKPDASG